jgi:hypothetical protein
MRHLSSLLSLAVAASLLTAMHAAKAAEPTEAKAPRALGKIKVTVDEEPGRSTVGNSTVVADDQLGPMVDQ